ncbi:MAG: acylphosphatase [Bacteroidia bacterium]|nr:acylphosphatase [Bacteroidia bacterium]
MPVHFNIRVSGLVQGVFFRASTKERAVQHGLTGFVRNEADGAVYVEVEGDSDNVRSFIDWCRHGPPART